MQAEIEETEILTYEEVALYYPQPGRQRPVILVGPSNVGRLELRQRLLDSSPHRFGAAIPRMLVVICILILNSFTDCFLAQDIQHI